MSNPITNSVPVVASSVNVPATSGAPSVVDGAPGSTNVGVGVSGSSNPASALRSSVWTLTHCSGVSGPVPPRSGPTRTGAVGGASSHVSSPSSVTVGRVPPNAPNCM